MVTDLAFVGAAGAAAAVVAIADALRWWTGGRVLARLGRQPARRPAPAVVTRLLDDAGIDGDARSFLRLWLAALALSLAATTVLTGGLVAFVALLVGVPAGLLAARGRSDRHRAAQVPLALDVIAASLRGGAAMTTAIGDAARVGGRLGDEFRSMARHVDDGMPLTDVVERWATERGQDTALAGAALSMAATVGGPGADAVESAAASLRDRATAAEEMAALSVQARLSAGILTVAPVGFAFLLVSLDPTSARFLLATPAGWACIVVGLGLDLVGAWWMSRLVRSPT